MNPARGHEQAGLRPALVLSTNLFNQGPAGLAIVLPITTRAKGIPFHVPVEPSEGGLKARSFIKCEDVRSVTKEWLSKRWATYRMKPRRPWNIESVFFWSCERWRQGGLSLRACNKYLRAAKRFSRWLRRDGRAAGDALAHLRLFKE